MGEREKKGDASGELVGRGEGKMAERRERRSWVTGEGEGNSET